MGKNFYNEEQQYSEVIQLLKSLEKIETPDNFEFNLYTKIQNKQFGNTGKSVFNFRYILAPTTAVLLLTALFFFIQTDFNQPVEDNPLMSNPVKISEEIQHVSSTQKQVKFPSKAGFVSFIENNDVVTSRKVNFPFNNSKNISLDEYISNGNKFQSNRNINLVSGKVANSNTGYFHYFYERLNKKEIDSIRAKTDR